MDTNVTPVGRVYFISLLVKLIRFSFQGLAQALDRAAVILIGSSSNSVFLSSRIIYVCLFRNWLRFIRHIIV